MKKKVIAGINCSLVVVVVKEMVSQSERMQ